MTGKPFHKTRIIISKKVIATRVGIDDFDEAAINFKHNITQSIATSRLNINIAIKSLGSGVLSTKKLTYENTDNKTRTNSGGEPGMIEAPGGIRYQPKGKNGPGKILSLFPSQKSRESNSKTSNFGWIDKNPNSSAEVYVNALKNKPQIRIRKFQVNPKTDEIIPESEITMSRFRRDNESDSNKNTKDILEKKLPGATLGERGTSLIGRAAGKFGIVRDALGKFRCPPGTPAANQFTDHMGTNCFGQSIGDLIDFAVDAFKLIDKLTEPNSRETLSKFFKELRYDADNGRFGSSFATTVWRDADGKKIRNLRKWNATLREGDYRIFPEGMARAQERLTLQDARVTNLMDVLGIIRTPETTKYNAHLHGVFDRLRETGALNVTLGDVDGSGTPFTPDEVKTMMTARLRAIDGFDGLSSAQKERIIQNDIDRYYETEKALLESYLDEYVQNPEHMKTVPYIVYEAKIIKQDEANTSPIVWSTGNVGSRIAIDIPYIMQSQETMLPQLSDNERLRIDVTGAKTDAEAAAVLSDFLITSSGYAKQHAATVEERAFARHIMKHEISHSIQFVAFHAEIQRQMTDKGFIEIVGKDGAVSKIESMDDFTSDDLIRLMDGVGDSIDLESLNSALSRTEVVMFMAGTYPLKDYRDLDDSPEIVAIEACAELWALRDLGLISGDDVDAALEWMDTVVDGRYVDKRIRSDSETMKIIEDSYYLSPGITSAPWYVPEDPVETAVRKRRAELGFVKTRVSKMGQDEIIELLASAELEKDRLESLIESIKKSSGDAGDIERELLELLDEIQITRSVWKKKYGVGGSSDKKTLDSLINSAREGRSMFTPDVIADRLRSKEITSFKLDAASIDDPDEIVAVLADYEIRLREVSDSEKKSLKEEFKIYQDRYKAILKDNGDSRKWTEQKRELDENIDKLVRPTKTGPLKKPQTFSNDKAAEKVASESRNELMRGRTTRQREAVIMFSDSETSSIAKILDPEKSSQVMNKIQLRNTRLKSRGKLIDPTSRSEGSVVDQIENILIPTMEVIDESRIGGNFEIEAVVEFQINEVTGDINIDEVSHDGFISGRVLSKKNPAVGKSDSYPVKNSKQKQRVIIQTTEEDRGIFPHWSMDVDKDDKRAQKLVLPPGKLRIVETRDDGTIVMQISEQKNTESILSTLPEALGAERGIKAKTQRLIDEYIVGRREKGIPRDSKRPLRSLETQDRGIIATREILKSGGRFGAGIPDDDVVDATLAADGVSVKTRGQQKVERIKSSKKIIEQLSDVLAGNENSDSSILSRDSLDPSVADIIVTKSPDEIIQLVENTAVEMHETMDKRTRVRMRESEVDDFTRTGRHGLSSGQQVSNSTTQSQTGNRLSRRSKSQARNLKNQEEASRKAAAEFKKFKADDMDDGRLDGLDADTLKNRYELVRSKQKSVLSDRPIYKTSSAERAIALLALGYEVEVPHAGERRMTANSASQMAEEIKGLAKQHVDDMELKLGRKLTESEKKDLETDFNEKYDIDLCRLYGKTKNIACSDNMRIERKDMPQVGGKTESIDSPAMRAFISGHIKGEYKPVNGLSDDDMARFKRIAGELQKPKTYNNVSEEDRGWVHSRTNWETTETKMEENFIDFLNKSIKAFDDKGNPTDAVVVKQIDPLTVAASQNQLRASQIDGTAKSILKLYNEAKVNWGKPGTPEFYEERAKWLKNAWFQGPILTSRDGMVVDGHHRWSAIILANQSLKDDEKLLLGVSEIQAPIHEALALGKSFQEHMGIRSNSVGKQTPRATGPASDKDISMMTKQEFDTYMSDFDTNFKSKTDDIKARGLYPIKIQNLDGTGTDPTRAPLVPSSERRGSQNRIKRVKFDKDKERSGFSSGAKIEKPEPSSSTLLVKKNLSVLQERSVKSEERVANLQKALDILERTGEWRGEEFGVTVGSDISATDLDVFDDGTPTNLSKEDIEKRFGDVKEFTFQVRKKLRHSEKENDRAQYSAKSKQVRAEQGTLDIEDLTPEQFKELLEETKSLTSADFDGAAVHAGQSELDGGVLDPSRTVGGTEESVAFGGGAGDTGNLNLSQIAKQREQLAAAEESTRIHKRIEQAFIDKKTTLKPESPKEADLLNQFFEIDTGRNSLQRQFKIGEEFDITKFYEKIDGVTKRVNSHVAENDVIIKSTSELLAAMEDGGKYGFLSAQSAEMEFITQGYFGRNAGSVVPKNVATHMTEFESSKFGGDGRRDFKEVKDPEMLGRWRASLRGTTYLVTDKKKITSNLGPDGERQILGKTKPVFAVSAPVNGYSSSGKFEERGDWGIVARALMARAIRLEKEGKEVNIENVLAARRGEPQRSGGLSLSSGAKSKRDIRRGSSEGLITRAASKILDSELKRRGVDRKTRNNVGFAIALVSAYDKDASPGFLSFIGKEITRRGGKELAEMALDKLVDAKKISSKQKTGIMKAVNKIYVDGIPESTKKNLTSVFNIASSVLDKKTKIPEGDIPSLSSGKRTTGKMSRQNSKLSWTKDVDDVLEFWNNGGNVDTEGGVIDSPEQPSTQRIINRKGSAADNYRTEYLSQIGIPRDTPDSLRPVSGYVVNKSHIEEKKKRARQLGSGNEGADAIFEIGDKDIVGDGLTALGEIEVVLRPETANRVAYGRGDSIDSLHQPVMLDSTERDDIVNAIMAHGGIDKDNKDLDAILHLLAASKDKNFSHINGSRDKDGKMKPVGKIDPSDSRGHEIFEANILGGFSKDEVEGIHYPYSKIAKLAEKEDISDLTQQDVIGPKLQKLGFTPEEIQYFYSISDGKPLNTASMQKLREYRAAKKIKKKYESAGIGYVKFAHPLGINIENPKTYDKTSGPRDNPEDILKRNIVKEMDEALKLMLKDMRKKKTRDFVGHL